MSRTRRLRGGSHSRYIDIDQKDERRRWAEALNVDQAVLREAVDRIA